MFQNFLAQHCALPVSVFNSGKRTVSNYAAVAASEDMAAAAIICPESRAIIDFYKTNTHVGWTQIRQLVYLTQQGGHQRPEHRHHRPVPSYSGKKSCQHNWSFRDVSVPEMSPQNRSTAIKRNCRFGFAGQRCRANASMG